MTGKEATAGCDADATVIFAESVYVNIELLSVATVCGALTGALAAALLYVFCLKPLLINRQGYNARRLLEPDDGEQDNNHSDCISNSRKEVPSGTTNEKEKKQPPMNSDVAAFASRAKVVYPINQKYRPLADGASNPSLHEQTRLPTVAHEESSSSTGEDSLSQEQDNDDSSHFISSSLVPKSLQNQSFTRVSHYPHTLTQAGFEGRISLYCLALQDIQQLCSKLQEDKYTIFLQMLKMIFSSRFPKDKSDADFCRRILQGQEKKINELQKQPSSGHIAERSNDSSCTLEEIERAQKDLFESSLHMSKGFSKQLADLFHHLLGKTSVFSRDEAQDVMLSLVQSLVSVENHLVKTQEAELRRIQEKLLWWEELTGLLQSQPAALKREVCLRLSLITTTLEQLTSDDVLTFNHMEKILSDVQGILGKSFQQCTEDCSQKTKELVIDRCNKIESKRKKLQRSQTKEKNRVLEQTQAHADLQQLTKEYQELLLRHRQQTSDLELQQESRVADALSDLWRKLRTSWSNNFRDQTKDSFLASVSAQSNVSAERCEKMWTDLEQEVEVQLQQVECTIELQLKNVRSQLDKDGQMWTEEMSLTQSCLKHLSEQQLRILTDMVSRQSYTLNRDVGRLVEKKHEHLLAAVQRSFVVRHFCLHLLKEMRLSKLKVLSQTDFRAVLMEDPSKSSLCVSSSLKNSSASLAEKHLGPESQLVSHSFQQEFLSELETGVELLQSHAQMVVGHALSQAVQQMMETTASESGLSSKTNDNLKHHLIEAVSESVYLTKDSLTALVQSYYSHLQDLTRNLLQEQPRLNQEINEKQESSSQLNRALQRELLNWGKKPTSAEFQQRVELNKRRALDLCDVKQEKTYEELRQKKVAQDRDIEKVKGQLEEAEEQFINDLANLARVSMHSPEPEPSEEANNAGDQSSTILDLLALNPALDPAKNPSLTPTVTTPVAKSKIKKKKAQKSHLS